MVCSKSGCEKKSRIADRCTQWWYEGCTKCIRPCGPKIIVIIKKKIMLLTLWLNFQLFFSTILSKNLPNGFRLSIVKRSTIFHAMQLFKPFHVFGVNVNSRNVHYTHSKAQCQWKMREKKNKIILRKWSPFTWSRNFAWLQKKNKNPKLSYILSGEPKRLHTHTSASTQKHTHNLGSYNRQDENKYLYPVFCCNTGNNICNDRGNNLVTSGNIPDNSSLFFPGIKQYVN